MKNRIVPYSIAIVAAMALAGCGQAGTVAGSTTSGSTAATTSAMASPTEKDYTNNELAAIIAKLKDPSGRAFTVIPAAQIDQGLEVARTLLKTAVITPKACAVVSTNNAQVPEGSTYAAGASLSAADKTTITVTVFAVKDASAMSAQLAASEKAASQCSTVTESVAGKKSTVKVTPVQVSTNGDKSLGALTSETAPTGQKVTSLTVTAVKGNLAATVVKAGAAITSAASNELVKLVNTVLVGQ
ncbi:hypothetical protein [Arthrobacter sp. ERGS1:01]|uniref:hypothetical protein n=1 Tax=Arthrobacter sp. ERGS1:01 TaxID=1704044 RepID=UPI000AED481E|nr:hypothetical protein [Arthrobacter sp. ERGS1:01]